jgi:hypothetical protein
LVLDDFFVFEVGDSLVVGSVLVDSVAGDFSVFVSDFLLFELLDFGLVALSAAGLLAEAGAFVVGAGDLVPSTFAFGLTLAFGVEVAAGVVVAATDAVAAGVIVAAVVAAGLALALVEAEVLVVVLGAVVVVVPVVPVVVEALTPKVEGTVTP